MQSNASFKYKIVAVFFIGLAALPLSAQAFSLSSLVEAHQERMQRRYELMSYRVCTVVSSLLPFVTPGSWCIGEGAKDAAVSDPVEVFLPPASELLILEAGFGTASTTPSDTGEATTTVATTTTPSLLP